VIPSAAGKFLAVIVLGSLVMIALAFVNRNDK
jgi:hypothetical protein